MNSSAKSSETAIVKAIDQFDPRFVQADRTNSPIIPSRIASERITHEPRSPDIRLVGRSRPRYCQTAY